jgi:hypothetical protein
LIGVLTRHQRKVSGGDKMEYETGSLIQAGDIVTIDGNYNGQVVASMGTSTCLPGYEFWA